VLQSARGSYFEIRDLLTGADAESWWDDLRGERSPVMVLWVVEADLDSSPPVVKLAPKRGGPAEVTLLLEYLHDWGLRVGEEVRFNGIPDSLTRNPFHLILGEGQVWPLRGDVDRGPRPSVSINIEPSEIAVGETATVRWASENAREARLNQGVGKVELSGFRDLAPDTTTTYTVSVRGPGGEATASASVRVRP